MKIMELIISYPELVLAAVCFFFLRHLKRKTGLPTNWPLVGMLPALLINLHRLHDWFTEILSKQGCTFVFKGPWFTNMANVVVTSDPANMRHIFNTSFANYPKGSEFKEFFDLLGDGIFNADSDAWKTQRKAAQQLIHHKNFQKFLEQTSRRKVENALIPVIEHVVEQNMVVDLQDLFKRFTFDSTTILFSGIDPCCLSIEFDKIPYADALDDAEEAIYFRHAMPVYFWKLQRLLGLGRENKLSKAEKNLDQFISQCISAKWRIQQEKVQNKEKKENGVDLLTLYIEEDQVFGSKSDAFFKETMLNFMVAGRAGVGAALTWFFWLISKNPRVETKIIEELRSKTTSQEGKKVKMFDTEELKGLVYLHSAFCESLRLFPSVPFEHKMPHDPDILPSGHRVDPKTKILPLLYAMGRMEEVWGKDCLEFKPERWISRKGEFEYAPSYKFMAFNSGPRTCLGKEIAFTQMRMVAATLLYNYNVEVVESHSISIKSSVILYMNNGMKARIKRRF